jgi:hypothetical protein
MIRVYDFPNAVIKVYPDRTSREFPKWCACINVTRSREYVREALCELRRRGRYRVISKG